MQISGPCNRSRLPTGPLSTEARPASTGNIALVAHRPNVDTRIMELTEEVEIIVAKIQPGGTLVAVTMPKP